MVGPRTSQSSTTSPNRISFTLIAIACLALIVLVGLAILISWVVIKPKKIQYSVDEGWIRGYNLTDNQLSSTFNFVLRTYNPNNKAKLYYDKMDVTVLYHGNIVTTNTIQPFVQAKQNVTRLMFQGSANHVSLPPAAVHDLKVERTGSEVDLDVKMEGKVRFKVGIWKSRKYKLKVLCSPVVVSFSDGKKVPTRDCEVDY